MTQKQENIIHSALSLFAEEGYTATSTSKVAKAAGVSEGLIFRHFTNKEGLLQAILKEGETKLKASMENILWETDPEKIIRKSILLPFSVPEEDHSFWRLQFKLKWELNITGAEKLEPWRQYLSKAFTKLGYTNPEMESQLLLQIIEGTSSSILKNELTNKDDLAQFLLAKYKV